MKLTKKFGIILSMSLMACASVAHADMYSNLGPDDQSAIDHDQQVAPAPEDVDGSAWPRVTIYQRVAATPAQAASVMFDYALHKTMFGPAMANGKVSKPGITASTPVTPGAAASDINYTMVFPSVLGIALPDEHYTVHDVLSAYGDGAFQIAWTMVKASSMKDTTGVVKFEPLPGGYTLVGYTNFISPPRPPLAKLIKSMYVQQVKDTVTSLVGQISNESSSNRSQLDSQLAKLNAALGL
jgi:hypothetical protein